jgi:succinylglutamate desuccinylase
MLTQMDTLPEGLLDCSATQLGHYLPGPSLIHLPGRRQQPVFVSVLLHGNEDTGWEAVKAVLRKYAAGGLPRALSLFIGNVAAAGQGLRLLDGQTDYNRIWDQGETPEHAMAQQVLAEMAARQPFVAIDIHNNTGLNPHYACINRLANEFLQLATLFGRTVVYFTSPDSVLSMAVAHLCPAVTVECGKPGQQSGVDHALEYLDACLHLEHLPENTVAPHDLDLFHTVATVKVPEYVDFGFGEERHDMMFATDLERFNFRELAAGTRFGVRTRMEEAIRLEAIDERGVDVSDIYFKYQGAEIILGKTVMPSMITLDTRVIRQDCLCYLMERVPFNV